MFHCDSSNKSEQSVHVLKKNTNWIVQRYYLKEFIYKLDLLISNSGTKWYECCFHYDLSFHIICLKIFPWEAQVYCPILPSEMFSYEAILALCSGSDNSPQSLVKSFCESSYIHMLCNRKEYSCERSYDILQTVQMNIISC